MNSRGGTIAVQLKTFHVKADALRVLRCRCPCPVLLGFFFCLFQSLCLKFFIIPFWAASMAS